MTAAKDSLAMAYVPLFSEVLNLAITEHWDEVGELQRHRSWSVWRHSIGMDAEAARDDENFSAGVEALAVALHARLQEQGTLG